VIAVFNVFGDEWDGEESQPGYRRRGVALGPRLGASKLGTSLYELPPGEKSFPYHYELGCEEWAIVLTGRPTLRDPEGERQLEPGDVVCFPGGPKGAHLLRNDTDGPVRVLLVSTKAPVAVARYPDSGKTMTWTRDEGAELYRETVEYYDGETG
jgi:uncharacterized cupin superfamily protein